MSINRRTLVHLETLGRILAQGKHVVAALEASDTHHGE
jgi:hypothetical protein